MKYGAENDNSKVPERSSEGQCNILPFADPKEVHGTYYSLAAILFFPSGVSKLVLYTEMVFIWLKWERALLASFKAQRLKKKKRKTWEDGGDPQRSKMMSGWEWASHFAQIMLSYLVKPLMLEFIY